MCYIVIDIEFDLKENQVLVLILNSKKRNNQQIFGFEPKPTFIAQLCCLVAQKTFFSYRNFGHQEFHFLKGKKLAVVKKMVFQGQCTTFLIIWKNKKYCFALARLVLAFGLEEGRRPSEGQKNPSNSPNAKTSLAKAKQFFLLFQMMRNVVH